MSEHAKVSRAALGIMGTRAGIYPIKIIVALVVAPLLGTANYGIYSYLILPGAVLMPLMTFGTTVGVRYYVSTEEYLAKDVSVAALLLGLLNGTVTALLFGWLWQAGWLGETGEAISLELMLPVLLVLPLQGLAWSMSKVMIGASWFTAMNLYMILNNLLPPIFLTALVIIAGRGVGGAVESIVATNVVLGIATTAMVFVRYRPTWTIDIRFLVKAGRYGIKAWIGSLANSASTRLDQFVLGFVQAPDALGVYRIAVMIAELLWVVPDAVSIPLFNRVSKTERLADRAGVVRRSHRVLVLVVLILGAAAFAVCWWAIPWLLGTEYIDARWLLGILVPGAVALVTSRLIAMFFMASGQPEKSSLIHTVGAFSSVVAYLVLIPLLGVAGAALATSMVYLIIAVTAAYMFRIAAGDDASGLFVARLEDVRWARSLIRDSIGIWRQKVTRAEE